MTLVNVRNLALKQFSTVQNIYAYYTKDDCLCLCERRDPESKCHPVDEKLGIDYVDRIHVPIPDNLTEYLKAIEQGISKQIFHEYYAAKLEPEPTVQKGGVPKCR